MKRSRLKTFFFVCTRVTANTETLMSGRGKGGKGLGKGGAKRHRMVLRNNILGITKPAIRRLARRGGVKRMSGLIHEETRDVLRVFLENVIRDAVTYMVHARRKTVTAMDCVYALKRQGRTLYGFGGDAVLPSKKKGKEVSKKSNIDVWDELARGAQVTPTPLYRFRGTHANGVPKPPRSSPEPPPAPKPTRTVSHPKKTSKASKGAKPVSQGGGRKLVLRGYVIGQHNTNNINKKKTHSDAFSHLRQDDKHSKYQLMYRSREKKHLPPIGVNNWYAKKVDHVLELMGTGISGISTTEITLQDRHTVDSTLVGEELRRSRQLAEQNKYRVYYKEIIRNEKKEKKAIRVLKQDIVVPLFQTMGNECTQNQCQFENQKRDWSRHYKSQLDPSPMAGMHENTVKIMQLFTDKEELLRVCTQFIFWLRNESYSATLNSLVQDQPDGINPAWIMNVFAVRNYNNDSFSGTSFEPLFKKKLDESLRKDGGVKGMIKSVHQICRDLSENDEGINWDSVFSESDDAAIYETRLQKVVDQVQGNVSERKDRDGNYLRDAKAALGAHRSILSKTCSPFRPKDMRYCPEDSERGVCEKITATIRNSVLADEDLLDFEMLSYDPEERWLDRDTKTSREVPSPMAGAENLLARLVIATQVFFFVVNAYCANKRIPTGASVETDTQSPQGLGSILSGQTMHGISDGDKTSHDALVSSLADVIAVTIRKRLRLEVALFTWMKEQRLHRFRASEMHQITKVFRRLYLRHACNLGADHHDHMDEITINLPFSPDHQLCFQHNSSTCTSIHTLYLVLDLLVNNDDLRETFLDDVKRLARVIQNFNGFPGTPLYEYNAIERALSEDNMHVARNLMSEDLKQHAFHVSRVSRRFATAQAKERLADIDALPIFKRNELPKKLKNPSVKC